MLPSFGKQNVDRRSALFWHSTHRA